jgi:hypothetical protein
MRFASLVALLFLSVEIIAQPVAITNFLVKEHLLKNSKLAIIAADSIGKPLEEVSGTFMFSINGFKQELKFNEGMAVAPQAIEKSTFVYLKHENTQGTHSKLFYVIKKDEDLNPIKINWLVLLLIPTLIIAIASIFRKLIIFAVVLLAAVFFFNSSKGLALPTFFETIIDGLKSMI